MSTVAEAPHTAVVAEPLLPDHLLIEWLILWSMYRRRIIVRL
jgi:hypothetical protein